MNPQGGSREIFLFQQASESMSSLRGLVRMHGNRRFDVVNLCFLKTSCLLSCPFFLIRKCQRIKVDIKGLPHIADAPPPCRPWPVRPTQSVFGNPSLDNVFSRFMSLLGTKQSRSLLFNTYFEHIGYKTILIFLYFCTTKHVQ